MSASKMATETKVKKRSLKNIFKGDKGIWMAFFFLCMISIVEVYSASSSMTYKRGDFMSPMLSHTSILLAGFGLMLVVMNIDCKYFKLISPLYFGITLLFLILVPYIGVNINGARRWLEIFGITFQPSELGKGALVLVVAQILSAMQHENGADKKAFKWIMCLSAVMILPILRENLSTAALLFMTVIFMMIVGRVPWSQLGKLLGVLSAAVFIIFLGVMVFGDSDRSKDDKAKQNLTEQTVSSAEEEKSWFSLSGILHRADTWKGRIVNFTKDDVPAKDYDLRNKDAQPGYANIAIVSSGIYGKGPGNSTGRDYLSLAYSDFIYAIIIEELGIEGAIGVIALYLLLFLRVGAIAKRLENPYPIFLSMGLVFILVTQAMFNMAVAVGLLPVTGQTLPLISKGGTSSIITCMYIGILLSISRSAKRKKKAGEKSAAEEVAVAPEA